MPFDIDTIGLKSFVAIAETLNFTRAAERVGRSQSALSIQIQKLELSLGQSLFDRSRKQIRLTEAGEIFLSYARRILDLQTEAYSRLSEPDAEGEIRLGTPEDFATHYLPGVLASFRRLHPRVQLNVGCELTLNLLAGFERGDYDMVLFKRDPQGFTGGQRVWREPLVWVAAEGYEPGEELSLALSPQPCIYRARALSALSQANRSWRISYISPSLAGTLAAVRAGLGISVLPAHMIPDDIHPISASQNLPDLPEAEIALLVREGLSIGAQMLARHIVQRLEQSQSYH